MTIEKRKWASQPSCLAYVTELGSYVVPDELLPRSVSPGPKRLKRQMQENRLGMKRLKEYGAKMDQITLNALFP